MHNSLSAVCYHGDFSCFYLISVAAVQVHQCAHMPSHLETRLVKLLVEAPSPSSTQFELLGTDLMAGDSHHT